MSNEAKLGTVPNGSEGRDAVHVAIIPARAAQLLDCGQPVKMNAANEAVPCPVDQAVGVVDPFRTENRRRVFEGEWFWLCLYPKTITGLRHVWEHPTFASAGVPSSPALSDDKHASEVWIADYVRKHCPYWKGEADGGYSEFVRYVEQNRWIFYTGSDCHSLEDVADADELFRHLSVVLGRKIDAAYFETFTCTC
jgi:hypothetical protein